MDKINSHPHDWISPWNLILKHRSDKISANESHIYQQSVDHNDDKNRDNGGTVEEEPIEHVDYDSRYDEYHGFDNNDAYDAYDFAEDDQHDDFDDGTGDPDEYGADTEEEGYRGSIITKIVTMIAPIHPNIISTKHVN